MSIENQLFDWERWDIIGTMVFQYYDITLNKDIGQYKKGEKFDIAVMDYGNSRLELYNNGLTHSIAGFNLIVDVK